MPSKRTLPVPLERVIDQSAPAHAQQLWHELEERRAKKRQLWGERALSTRALISIAACFVMLLGSALALTLGFRMKGREERPLLIADRTALPAQIEATASYRALDLSDGSRVTVAQGAHLDVLETSPRTVSFALRSGRVRFDVRPRGPRSWRIECGAFSVEVVGTKFVLERSSDEVSVRVLHGAVLVRGSSIADGVQRLNAGQSLRTRAPLRAAAEVALQSAPIVVPIAPPLLVESALLPGPRERASRRGRALAGVRNADVDALFRAADAARLRGNAREAAGKLQRILDRHADDTRASLAGFALARLQLAALHEPAQAAQNLKLAISLGLPRALLEDAYGKLAEAYEQAGAASPACDAFRDYRQRFPHGERALRPPQQCQVDNTQ